MNAQADLAARLVAARREGTALDAFPGPLPSRLDEAYAVQMAAIDQWDDTIAGWKVGRLSPDLVKRWGVRRFVGPVFLRSVGQAVQGTAPFAMFAGGSAAFEAEYVLFAGYGKGSKLVPVSMMTGIEVASSPISCLPSLGSLATVADLGNNAGLILGQDVDLALLDDPQALVCETVVGAQPPVRMTAASLRGGPLAAFAFAARQVARMGYALQLGQFVSTGAVTGMHSVALGDHACADFDAFGSIHCPIVMRPASLRI